MNGPSPPYPDAYRRALAEHLANSGEETLHLAYALGRRALDEGLGVLDMADVLLQAIRSSISSEASQEACLQALKVSEGFLLESLSPFEMAHRGVRDANDALRRQNDVLEEQIKRIAHDLHDSAGQLLVTVHFELERLAQDLAPELRPRVQDARRCLDRVEDHLRRISHELRPTMLDDLGLVPALQFLSGGVSERMGISVRVEGSTSGRLPAAVETALYRIVQECLVNAGKHARATEVVVEVERTDAQVRCTIRDNGVGLEGRAAMPGAGSQGIGLKGIRERVSSLGGSLAIDSRKGHGTAINVTIPLEIERAAPTVDRG